MSDKYDAIDEHIICAIGTAPGIKFDALFRLVKDDCRKLSTRPLDEHFRVLDRRLQQLRRDEEITWDRGWYLTGALLKTLEAKS